MTYVFAIVTLLLQFLGIGWLVRHGRPCPGQAPLNARTAYTGFALTLLLTGWGIYCFMSVVAGLYGDAMKPWGAEFHWAYVSISGLVGVLDFLLATLTGGLAIQCHVHVIHGETVAFFENLQAFPASDPKQDEELGRRIMRSYRFWLLGAISSMVIVLFLDGSFLSTMLVESWSNGVFQGVSTLATMLGFAFSSLVLSLIPVAALYGLFAVAEARWGPPKQPWFTVPAQIEPTKARRFIGRVYNLIPLGRSAGIAFWLVILLVALATAGVELHERLASGDWPRWTAFSQAGRPRGGPTFDSANLAMALFYVPASAARLWRRLRPGTR